MSGGVEVIADGEYAEKVGDFIVEMAQQGNIGRETLARLVELRAAERPPVLGGIALGRLVELKEICPDDLPLLPNLRRRVDLQDEEELMLKSHEKGSRFGTYPVVGRTFETVTLEVEKTAIVEQVVLTYPGLMALRDYSYYKGGRRGQGNGATVAYVNFELSQLLANNVGYNGPHLSETIKRLKRHFNVSTHHSIQMA